MNQENRLPVTYEGAWSYDIFLQFSYEEILSELKKISDNSQRKICIVTDSNVAKIYVNEIVKILENDFCTIKTYTFDAGEESKNLNIVGKLYKHLINEHFERGDLLIALGGGVVGDLTGFAAATYLRGIDFVQMPSTLLSQVDSSIGGKTGVDFLQYKNMVGAFNQPKLVFINLDVLKTLPKEQFYSGMAEVIKHGLIKDSTYFQFLADETEAILALEQNSILKMILESCYIKREVVQNDPKENGERALLNFGHTIGHAIEKLSDFTLFHGECVALGMVAASYISYLLGNISIGDLNYIKNVIKKYHLPLRLNNLKNINEKDILDATKSDKKMTDGKVKFVLLNSIGSAYISNEIDDNMLLKGIQYVIG